VAEQPLSPYAEPQSAFIGTLTLGIGGVGLCEQSFTSPFSTEVSRMLTLVANAGSPVEMRKLIRKPGRQCPRLYG
jgi:hypothetical protein